MPYKSAGVHKVRRIRLSRKSVGTTTCTMHVIISGAKMSQPLHRRYTGTKAKKKEKVMAPGKRKNAVSVTSAWLDSDIDVC